MAEDVSWVRDGTRILSSVSCHITADECVSLIGPNGGGKTSLVRILLGLEQPTTGRVWRDPHLKIGYVPQVIHVDRSLPLNVRRFLKLFQTDPNGQESLILSHLGVDTLMPRFVQDLSRGQWQRVLLARALLSQPNLVVLDEPTQGLDITGEAAYYQQIQWLRETFQISVWVISHDLHWVMAKTDRVYCLNGHMCCSGAPGVLISDPAYHNLFKTYSHHHDHTH